MKEMKSFFGGLRRGNKKKETSDAVSPEEKNRTEYSCRK
jgi:archaeal flagellar protein FlaI